MNKITLCVFLLGCLFIGNLCGQEPISYGRFQNIILNQPKGEVKAFVLLLTDATTSSTSEKTTANISQNLANAGAMVATISPTQLLNNLEADPDDCVFPDGDLENLAHYLQGYAQLPNYFTPLLIGEGVGAPLAYAVLAQAPKDTFAGAITFGFNAYLPLKKPLCQDSNLHFSPHQDGGGVDIQLADALNNQWINAEPTTYLAAYQQLIKTYAPAQPTAAPDLKDLPITEIPNSQTKMDTFAIFLSGDGGWAGLDKEVAATLAAKGIPVVGFDSLRYFWKKRTPQGLTDDVQRMLNYYSHHWQRRHAILIGYSQGADVLPFVVNRLPPRSRHLITQTILMGLSEKAAFEFHLGNWLSDDENGIPIRPEMQTLSSTNTLCIYGTDEEDSLCPKLDARLVHAQSLPGDHHFNEDYAKLTQLILQRLL